MRIARFIFLTIIFGAFVLTAEPAINPETVLISRFNFVRPQTWQWVETRSNPETIQQSVTFSVDNSDECSVFIHHFLPQKLAGTPQASARRWKESFPDVKGPVAFEKPILVGTNKVFYLEITGTHKPENPRNKKDAVRSNITQLGAVIEDGDGNLVLRLIGPAPLVEKAKPDFKKMIETALQQE